LTKKNLVQPVDRVAGDRVVKAALLPGALRRASMQIDGDMYSFSRAGEPCAVGYRAGMLRLNGEKML